MQSLTLAQAKTLPQGGWIYHMTLTNADGSPKRYKVTSVKTWKTRPNEVIIKTKHGLKQFYTINQNQMADFSATAK